MSDSSPATITPGTPSPGIAVGDPVISRPPQLAPMRVGDNATVHLGSLSSIKGPQGEPRYVSWCPASQGRDGVTTTVGEALADQITCRRCLSTAPTDALQRARTTAEAVADQQIAAKYTPAVSAELLGTILSELIHVGAVGVDVYANAIEVSGGADHDDSVALIPGEFSLNQVAAMLHIHPEQITDCRETTADL